MAAFDQLHPALQHHVVNSLGWRELRPFQEEVIPVVLRGDHAVVIAPTAGGKTEAAVLPLLSRMLTEDWRGTSVLYLCPTKALLNNLQLRLSRYVRLVGRSCRVWHGDTPQGQRASVHREPPDILLTTPESLESMLISARREPERLLGHIRAVVVDELHAFAAGDRGWHLLAVLQRVSRLAGRGLQRVGLSATVGNPDELLRWMVANCERPGVVVRPPTEGGREATVQLDFVGSLENAALVISRLHRGEKRLVFVDSRARAELLAAGLRHLEVQTFVTHSSLAKAERLRAEQAFAAESDCVIVATSVLELGVDVGDLDRVIQIDAPATVASFLQRMGRTGRRHAMQRNCLLLATDDLSLLQAAALLDLWQEGLVEDVRPPDVPYHVLVQQLLALALQVRGFIASDWRTWIGQVPAFAGFGGERVQAIIGHLLQTGLLADDQGVVSVGPEAERRLGHRHFMELLSVITSEPLFQVRHGQNEIGFVHPLSFAATGRDQVVLTLGGRGWRLLHVDWNRKTAQVEPVEAPGRSAWAGTGIPLSPRLCATIKLVLERDDSDPRWSRRARERIARLRQEHEGTHGEETLVLRQGSALTWWTFAGLLVNQTVVRLLQNELGMPLHADNLSIELPGQLDQPQLLAAMRQAAARQDFGPDGWEDTAADLLKFADLLPRPLLEELLLARLADLPGAHALLASQPRFTVRERVPE